MQQTDARFPTKAGNDAAKKMLSWATQHPSRNAPTAEELTIEVISLAIYEAIALIASDHQITPDAQCKLASACRILAITSLRAQEITQHRTY